MLRILFGLPLFGVSFNGGSTVLVSLCYTQGLSSVLMHYAQQLHKYTHKALLGCTLSLVKVPAIAACQHHNHWLIKHDSQQLSRSTKGSLNHSATVPEQPISRLRVHRMARADRKADCVPKASTVHWPLCAEETQ